MSKYRDTYNAMLDYIGADRIESYIVSEKGLTQKGGKYSCCMHSHKNPYKMTFHRESMSFRCHDEETYYGLGNLLREKGLTSKEILEFMDKEFCNSSFLGGEQKLPKKEKKVDAKQKDKMLENKAAIERILREGDVSSAIVWLREERGIQAKIEANMPILKINDKIYYLYYDICGNVVRVKVRKPNKQFLTVDITTDQIKQMPYNLENCKNYDKPLYIVEGEQDVLALYSIGYQAITLGSSSDMKLAKEAIVYDELIKYKQIVEMMDQDDKGRKAAGELKETLPQILSVKKELFNGCKDANELLQKKGEQSLRRLAEAIQIDDNLVDVSEIKSIRKKEVPTKTIFEDLNAHIGGWYSGTLNVVAGGSGSGKTTFVNQAVILSSLLAGEKVFWYNAEFDNEVGLTNLLQSVTKNEADFEAELKGVVKGKKHYRYGLTQAGFERLKLAVQNKLIMFKDGISNDPNKVLIAVEKLARLQGAKVVVLDNLMCLRDYGIDNDNNAITTLVIRLKELANELGLKIFIVAHTKKGQKGMEDQESISGTSNIGNLSDTVMIISRQLEAEEKNNFYVDNGVSKLPMGSEKPLNSMKLILGKNRIDGDTGTIEFIFDAKTRRYDTGDGEVYTTDYERELNKINLNTTKFKTEEFEDISLEGIF